MALSTLTSLKTYLRISDTSQDTLLTQLLAAAERAALLWTKRTFDIAVITEYHSGKNQPKLTLRQRPARLYQLTGTTTNASTGVTGISSTTNLVVGMPVAGTGIAAGTTISAIPSSTTVTLSAAATASGSVTLSFGLRVYLDQSGQFGQASGAFATTTILTVGTDYALETDQSNGSSKSALLIRLGGTYAAGPLDWPFGWSGVRRGTLTARLPPSWPQGHGNIKVVYTAGYASADMPSELAQAVNQMAAAMRVQTPVGVPVDVTSISGQWSDLLSRPTAGEVPELTTARQILRSYRESAF